jgi:hypothetical protein
VGADTWSWGREEGNPRKDVFSLHEITPLNYIQCVFTIINQLESILTISKWIKKKKKIKLVMPCPSFEKTARYPDPFSLVYRDYPILLAGINLVYNGLSSSCHSFICVKIASSKDDLSSIGTVSASVAKLPK